MADTPFQLEPPSPAPQRIGGGGGTRKGIKNKRSNVLWRKAEAASPEILEQRIVEAQKLSQYVNAGDMDRATIALRCGDHILNRTMPKPRSSPVLSLQVDQTVNPQMLLAAVAAGDLTAGDASSLLGALNKNLLNGHTPTPNGNGGDAKKKLLDKLKRAVEARQAANGSGDPDEEITLEALDNIPDAEVEAVSDEEIIRAARERHEH